MGDAVAVGDDQRGSVVGLRLEKCLRGLRHLRAEGHSRHVDMSAHVRQQPEILLPDRFPEAANLADAPSGVAFDAWPPVFEYTSVSITRMFTLRRFASTWSRPP